MNAARPVVLSALARLASFLPAALATLATSHIAVEHFGVAAFDSFALTVAVISLIPLEDLGVGASITSTVAERGPLDERSVRVTLTATRTLTVSALGVGLVSVALGITGAWHRLLGAASGPNGLVAVAVCLFALSFVPGLGQPMLLGVERNHVVVMIQSLWNPLMLAGTVALLLAGAGGSLLVLVPAASVLVVNVATAAFAIRQTRFPWRAVLRRLPWPRRYPGASIRAIAAPMLMITLTVPILLQSDRIILSHVSTQTAVADYTVTLQIFAPIAALIAAAAQPLWPIWAKARAGGERGPRLVRVLAIFIGGTAFVCAPLVVIADPIGTLIGGKAINLGILLPTAAALAVLMQAAALPVSRWLMYPAGMWFMGGCTGAALPINIGLSVVFAQRWGAPGPLFATVLVGLFVQTVPALLYVGTRGRRGRHRRGVNAGQDQVTVAVLVAASARPLLSAARSGVDQ